MSFCEDNQWQREIRDRILAPNLYGKYSVGGRYVFLDRGGMASLLQKRHAVDTIMQRGAGEAVCIEEKLTRWKGRAYSNFFLETKSCTVPGHESDGWMVYGSADLLLYGFVQEGECSVLCYLIDFQQLKQWFWPRHETYPRYVMPNTTNHTEGRLVPIEDVRNSPVSCKRFSIRADGAA